MTKLSNIEFFRFEKEVWFRDDQGNNLRLSQDRSEVLSAVCETIESVYPRAHEALLKEYRVFNYDLRKQRFKIVDRFIRCNFGSIDHKKDIDARGHFNFEHVECPLRGICAVEGVVCAPQINTDLGKCEYEVLELWFRHYSQAEIAEKLIKSEETVHNQIFRGYRKLNVSNKAEFVDLAHRIKLFKEEE